MNTPDKILVWDLPVRVFHALLALSFFGAFITAESERWARVHIALGYTVAGLVAFRLLLGLLGTRTARFASFVRSPRAAWAYLKSLLGPRPQHHVGHNPAGGWAIVGLLGLALVTTLSGWLQFNDLGPGWLEDLHEGAANTMDPTEIVRTNGVSMLFARCFKAMEIPILQAPPPPNQDLR